MVSSLSLNMQEPDIEVDENGTLDLSMKKTKRDGMQSPDPSSSSSSSSQHVGTMLSQVHTQSDWDSPLDFTKSSEVKEEDHEEVLKSPTDTFYTKKIQEELNNWHVFKP